MAFVIQQPSLGYPQIGDVVADTDEYIESPPLGTIVTAVDPDYGSGEFIYLAGVASTVVGSWVTYNADNFSTTLIVPNAIGPVAIATAATVASTSGWYQIQGKANASSADVADNADVYIDTAAGFCDDVAVTGDRVWGAKWASDDDTATGRADVEVSRPFVNDGLNAGTT